MREGSPLEVFLTFLKLGMTSFGGSLAHVGYFREEMVVRRPGSAMMANVDSMPRIYVFPYIPARARYRADGAVED
jgi:hypothetical protein